MPYEAQPWGFDPKGGPSGFEASFEAICRGCGNTVIVDTGIAKLG